MKKMMLIAALLAVPGLAMADATFTLTSGGLSAIEVDQGASGSLALTVGLGTTDAVGAFAAKLSSNVADVFTVTGRTWISPIADVISLENTETAPGIFGPVPGTLYLTDPGVMSPTSEDIGALLSMDVPATYFPLDLETLTLSFENMAPGTYEISLAGMDVGNTVGGTVNVVPVGDAPVFTMTVTPEPASLMLLGLGGLFLRRRSA